VGKAQTIRFASGSPDEAFSCVWRLVATNNDVFIGASKASMGIFKISLHKSGVWILAATSQSGATFENGNRRAKQWNRPLQHTQGITRGPSVIVPHTYLGSRPLQADEIKKKVLWYSGPPSGEVVEFTMYFVEPGIVTQWNSEQTVLAELSLARGNRLVLLASARLAPADFMALVERTLRENVFRMKDPSKFESGSLLCVTQSRDALATPMVIDLPVPIGPDLPSGK
jgi:hypothetical protein